MFAQRRPIWPCADAKMLVERLKLANEDAEHGSAARKVIHSPLGN
jgi:hypothetical protein